MAKINNTYLFFHKNYFLLNQHSRILSFLMEHFTIKTILLSITYYQTLSIKSVTKNEIIHKILVIQFGISKNKECSISLKEHIYIYIYMEIYTHFGLYIYIYIHTHTHPHWKYIYFKLG